MGAKANKNSTFLLEKIEGTGHSKDLGIDGVIIMKLIFCANNLRQSLTLILQTWRIW
jgi:hypothetical protein